MTIRDRKATVQSVVLFAALVNVLGWLGPVLGGDPTSPGLGFLIWGTAPLVTCVLLRALAKDWGDFGIRPRLRQNASWYLLSIVANPIAIPLTLGLAVLLKAASVHDFSWAAFFRAFLLALAVYMVSALFEEVGWRGYLAPKLYSLNLNAFAAHALVGVIWASWHFPYIGIFAAYTGDPLASYVPRFFLGTFVFAIVYGEVRIRTRSFWSAVVMHGIGNATAVTLLTEFVTLPPGRAILGSFGADGLMIACFGLLGLLLTLRRVTRVGIQGGTSDGYR